MPSSSRSSYSSYTDTDGASTENKAHNRKQLQKIYRQRNWWPVRRLSAEALHQYKKEGRLSWGLQLMRENKGFMPRNHRSITPSDESWYSSGSSYAPQAPDALALKCAPVAEQTLVPAPLPAQALAPGSSNRSHHSNSQPPPAPHAPTAFFSPAQPGSMKKGKSRGSKSTLFVPGGGQVPSRPAGQQSGEGRTIPPIVSGIPGGQSGRSLSRR